MSNDWNIRFVTEWDEIYSSEFQDLWRKWYNNAFNSHVFFHPALCMAWIETYRPLRNLSPIFCIAEFDSAVIFMPLVLWKQNWKNAFCRMVVPVGYADFDYHDPIINIKVEENKLTEFWKELYDELNTHFNYDQINIDGLHFTDLPSEFKLKKQEKCPYIFLKEFSSIEDYKKDLPKKLSKNIDRRTRRIKEQGLLEYKIYDRGTIDQALNELPKMLRHHSSRWPNSYKAPNFHKNIIHFGLDNNILHFSTLSLGNETISWRLCFIDTNKYYSFMPTIHPDYSKFSIGNIHLLSCIEEAIKSGKIFYDHMRGDELYKNEWTSYYDQISTYGSPNYKFSSVIKNYFVTIKSRLF